MNWLPEKKTPMKAPTKKDELWFAPWYIIAAHGGVYTILLTVAAAALSGVCLALVWGFANYPMVTGVSLVFVLGVICFNAVIDYDSGDLQRLKFAARAEAEKDFEQRQKAYEAACRGQ